MALNAVQLKYATVLDHLVPYPTVLGIYKPSSHRSQSLSMSDIQIQANVSGSPIFVLFRRAAMGSARFHLDILRPRKPSRALSHTHWYPTTPKTDQLSSRIDDHILSELNSTYRMHSLLQYRHDTNNISIPDSTRNVSGSAARRSPSKPRIPSASCPPLVDSEVWRNRSYFLRQVSARLSLLKYMASCRPASYDKLDASTGYHEWEVPSFCGFNANPAS
ncbi:hypothetical protein OF83DRAFT_69772 [Amylostereum chailletii]|nr:hypothetical protein OF83DRAFT_69772 [Amylostereum chailletii]